MGNIADIVAKEESPKTPLRIELDNFIKIITIISLVLGVGFLLIGWLGMGYKLLDCVVIAIGIIVANVPEGCMGAITVGLA